MNGNGPGMNMTPSARTERSVLRASASHSLLMQMLTDSSSSNLWLSVRVDGQSGLQNPKHKQLIVLGLGRLFSTYVLNIAICFSGNFLYFQQCSHPTVKISYAPYLIPSLVCGSAKSELNINLDTCFRALYPEGSWCRQWPKLLIFTSLLPYQTLLPLFLLCFLWN